MEEKYNHRKYIEYLKAHFEKLLLERNFPLLFVDSDNNEIGDKEFSQLFDDFLYFLLLMLHFEIPSFYQETILLNRIFGDRKPYLRKLESL